MKSLVFYFIAVLISAPVVFGQPNPDTLWTRTYGGSGTDDALSVQQTNDGGYIIAGYTLSFGAGLTDVYLIKTNSSGDTLWTRIDGGSNWDEGFDVEQTDDGGYIVVGRTGSYGVGGRDFYVLKKDSIGNSQWTRTYGGPYFDLAYSVLQTAEGGYILAGDHELHPPSFSSYEGWLVKINSIGDTLWTRLYGGSNFDQARSIDITNDAGYFLVGTTESFSAGSRDLYTLKTDPIGDTLWTRTYGGIEYDYGVSGQQTSDGGYIVAGFTESFGAGGRDFYLIRTNSIGDTLWTRTYGGTQNDEAWSLDITNDGGYILAGLTHSYGAGGSDVYLVRTNDQGDTLWTKTYGGSGNELSYSVKCTNDGGYILAGYTDSFGAGGRDFYVVKTGPDTAVSHAPSTQPILHPRPLMLHPAYPNPFNSQVIIRYEVPVARQVKIVLYNLVGRVVEVLEDNRIEPGIYTMIWDAGENPSGIYFYRMDVGGFTQTRKLLLMK